MSHDDFIFMLKCLALLAFIALVLWTIIFSVIGENERKMNDLLQRYLEGERGKVAPIPKPGKK